MGLRNLDRTSLLRSGGRSKMILLRYVICSLWIESPMFDVGSVALSIKIRLHNCFTVMFLFSIAFNNIRKVRAFHKVHF